MRYRPSGTSIRGIACAMFTALIVMISAGQSHAQQNTNPAVTTFLANPNQILTLNSDDLRKQVGNLAAADPATLTPILALLTGATPEQKEAIGKGLGDAAKAVLATNQPYSVQIQTAVIRARDDAVRVAFANIVGDVFRLGGIGAGPGGVGGGVGGQTNPQGGSPTSTGGPQFIGSAGTNTGLFTYSSNVTGLNNPSRSVSP